MFGLDKFATRVVLILAACALLAGAFGIYSWQRTRAAKTEARLANGQAGAASQSGRDAANTVGARSLEDAATDAITRENEDAIRNAEGAGAPVAGAVRDAGLASLCRRAAYRRDPKCLQHARP